MIRHTTWPVPESVAGEAFDVRPDDVAVNPVRLAVFCAVAEHGNFSRAAERLHVTQPTVSGHVQALEQALGARLFERHRRGAQLTEAGRVVYEYAVTVLRELAAARGRLRALASGEVGTVRLGAGFVPGTYVLPDLLAAFHRQCPEARVQLVLGTPDAISGEVQRGRLDFGVINEALAAEGLWTEPLWTDDVIVVAPSGHPLAGRPVVTLAELAGVPFVIGGAPTLGDQALERALVRAGLGSRRVVLEVGSLEGVKRAVREGVGLGIVFRGLAAAELATGTLVALPVSEVAVVEQFLLIARHPVRFTPLAERLIAFLRAEAPRLAAGPGVE